MFQNDNIHIMLTRNDHSLLNVKDMEESEIAGIWHQLNMTTWLHMLSQFPLRAPPPGAWSTLYTLAPAILHIY